MRTFRFVLWLVLLASPLSAATQKPLVAPTHGKVVVAFALSEGANVIDFAGPWEVFQDTHVPSRGPGHDAMMPFQLIVVAPTLEPITATGGLRIVPGYTYDTAPQPDVVVVPAQRGGADLHAWLRRVKPKTQIVLSVCTGAFQLAKAGLLDGRPATTHHDFFDTFAGKYPQVRLLRDRRFVDDGDVATAAGLTSGVDLALHVVERFFGREVATATAAYMEHRSTAWQE